jgi:hypothetical protein
MGPTGCSQYLSDEVNIPFPFLRDLGAAREQLERGYRQYGLGIPVDGRDVVASGDGDVGWRGGARVVAGEVGVGDREDGVDGGPLALG